MIATLTVDPLAELHSVNRDDERSHQDYSYAYEDDSWMQRVAEQFSMSKYVRYWSMVQSSLMPWDS